MARVFVSRIAQADTADIARYLSARAGLQVAGEYLDAFEALYLRLAAFPESGAPRPRLGPGIRVSLVRPYLIFHQYDRESGRVGVIRVMHERRKVTPATLRLGPAPSR